MTGRLQSVSERAGRARDEASERIERLRTDYDLIEAAFEVGELDRRRAGSLLAGGIAFRIFLWLLPAALVAAGFVGLIRPRGSAQPDHVARVLGLGASVVSIVHQATRESQKGTVALLAIGIPLTLYASMSLVRAFRVAHVLAWEELPRRRGHTIRDGALLSVALIGAIALESAIAYLRHSAGVGVSLLLGLVPIAITGALWLAASTQLPHADADRRALLPGAVIVAVGIAVLHFATIYYFAPKLTRAPALYGSLGTAATLLAWLFLIARLVVSSAFVNATLWRRRAAAGESPSAGDALGPRTAKNGDN
jgi:uncharacterized BrkB/YihY/UPF0761 family membrane protein